MVRTARLLASISVALAAIATAAAPAHAAGQVARVSASVVKPLTLTWLQDLDLGSIVLGPGTWSNATVAISQAGVFSCTNSNVTCTGATKVAQYKLTGTNNMTVRITAPNVTLVNQNDPTKTLVLMIDSPGTVAITSSGAKGVNFGLGGSLTVNSATAGGVYNGTLNVTVDY